MIFTELTLTQKWRDVLNDDSQVIFLEGPSQTSKTTLESSKIIMDVVQKSPKGETVIFLCGESTNTLYRNFVEKDVGITKLFPYMTKYVADNKRGGERIEVIVPYNIDGEDEYEIKKIYFIGYTTINSENKLLGGKPYMVIADEINKAHDQFVKQIFTRVMATNCKLLATSNGDDPDKMCYQYLNSCVPNPKWQSDIPKSTLQYMEDADSKEGWTYYFFGLHDRPEPPKDMTMNQWVESMYKMHPVGSFSYNAYVLGIRGATDGILYGHLIKNSHNVLTDDLNFTSIIAVTTGADVGTGGEVEGNARTVIVFTAYSKGYQRAVVLDALLSEYVEHAKVIEEANQKLDELYRAFNYKIKGVWVDSAERALIETWRKPQNKVHGIDIYSSIKSNKSITARSRVSLKEQLLLKDRLLFAETWGAQFVRQQLSKVKGKNGETFDENAIWNDVNDALDYSLTPMYHQLLNARI